MKKSTHNTTPIYSILLALSLAHCLNDTMQSVVSAIYPLLKENLSLNFAQIGAITLTYQISASIFQPICGYVFDKKPASWFLPVGLLFTMIGLLMISISTSLEMLICAVFFSGIGSSVLHPEASRLTSMSAGTHKGLAQSIFQVGGSTGYALGPLLAAIFVSPYGQKNVAIFSVCAFVAIIGLLPVCRWYARKIKDNTIIGKPLTQASTGKPLPKRIVYTTLAILIFLVFTKNSYTVSISNYYTFYLMQKFSVSVEASQIMLFAFLLAGAAGTLLGGPIGDKIGRRLVIWWSILGAAPFALLLPYANLTWTVILSMVTAFVMSSAFSAILIYAQELFPKNVGMISGLFFGLAFGVAGIMSAVLGNVADAFGLDFVYKAVALFPITGIVAYFLPRVRTLQKMRE